MRGLALTAVIALLLVSIVKHPVIGAYLWAWLSLMNPHKLTYGFAFSFPFAQLCAAITVLALVFTRKRQPLPINSVSVVHLTLVAWITLTSFFAIAPYAEVFDRWVFVMKIQFMMFVTLMLVTEAKQLRVLIWVVTFSVAYYGIKGGIFTLATGGAHRVWGPPGGMIEENNALAVCLIMLIPMMYFLRQTEPRAWLRHTLTICMITVVFAILGSQSRGALLALAAMALFLGLKGKYPVRTSLGIGLLVGLAIAFMPESWTLRMATIETYTEEGSAMSRIRSWITMWNVAVDRPLVGAGLVSNNAEVFARYAPVDGVFAMFEGRIWVAHSIYFQMLGEHGFVGLGLFLLLGFLTWRTAGRLARRMKDDAEFGAWMPMLLRMVQVSLVGYAVGGAFLNLAYFDVPYYFVGFVVLCDALVRRRARQGATGTSAAQGVRGAALVEAAHARASK